MGDGCVDELRPVSLWKEKLPVVSDGCELDDAQPDRITAVMPFSGQGVAVSALLKKSCGLSLPDPNRALFAGEAKIVWMGPDQAFVLGAEISETPKAAIVDQSDGWAVFRLKGPASADVLARLAPVDLRLSAFDVGYTARTALFHVNCSITRTAPDAFDIMVFRSMADTALGEIAEAMKLVAARNIA